MGGTRRWMPWIAGVLWGLALAVVVFMGPIIGVPGLVIAIGIGSLIAMRHRRTMFLSGLLVGLGGLWLVAGQLARDACSRAAECTPSEIGTPLAIVAMGLVIVGLALLRADSGGRDRSSRSDA